MPHQFPPIVEPPLTCEFHGYKKYFTQRILKQDAGRQNNYLRMLKRAVGFTTLRHHSLDDLRAQHPAGCRSRLTPAGEKLSFLALVRSRTGDCFGPASPRGLFSWACRISGRCDVAD